MRPAIDPTSESYREVKRERMYVSAHPSAWPSALNEGGYCCFIIVSITFFKQLSRLRLVQVRALHLVTDTT